MSDAELVCEQSGGWGIITLNRPKALNALTHAMVRDMRAALDAWAADDTIKAVLVRGAEDRAFCAGGDIRWLHDAARDHVEQAHAFFRDEYTNNATIFHFPKPYIALIDGIVMGGGVGVSLHGTFRVAGDRTMFAMPETGIGLFPDVGGGYFMPRMSANAGLYFALTGARAKAGDCLETGLATHYVPSDQQEEMVAALMEITFSGDAPNQIETILDSFSTRPENAPIADNRQAIEQLFEMPDSIEALLERLKKAGTPFANETLDTLSTMSPTSLKITLEQMRRGADLEFDDVMVMEFRIVSRVMTAHDFFEGVRALIIDKDKSPKWAPASVDEITSEDVAAYFEPIKNELQL